MYEDNAVEFEIRADDRKARPAIERTNSSLERIEKAAGKMFDTVDRAFNGLNRLLTRTAETLGVLYLVKQGYDRLSASMSHHIGIGDRMINTYRGLRLALSPTMLTGFTVAAGVAAEAVLRLSLAEARLIDQQALLAKRSGLSFGDVRSLSFASRAMNLEPSFWAKAAGGMSLGAVSELGIATRTFTGAKRSSADMLRDVAAAYEELRDPVERAALAYAVFGDKAEEILPSLDKRLLDNIETARRWGVELDAHMRTAISNLKRDFDEMRNSILLFGNQFSAAWEVVRSKVVQGAAAVNEIRRGILPTIKRAERYDPVTGRELFGENVPSFENIYQDWYSNLNKTKVFGLPGVPAQGVFEGMAARAGYLSGREGLQARLSQLSARRSALVANFEMGPALVSSALVPIAREMQVVEARLKVLEKQDEALRREEAIIEKLGKFEYKEPQNDFRGPLVAPSLLYGRNYMPREGIARTPELMLQRRMIELNFGMPGSTLAGRTAGNFGVADLEARYVANLKAAEHFEQRRLQYQIKTVELTAGPGGELAAIEKIYQLRKAAGKTAEDYAEAAWDREERILEVQKQRFDELRSSFEGLFDAAFSGARSFWDAMRRFALSIFLTPIKRALSEWVAGTLMGRSGSSGGILSGLGGLFGFGGGGFGGGGVNFGVPTPGYATGSGTAQSVTSAPGMIGWGMTDAGVPVFMGSNGVGGRFPQGNFFGMTFRGGAAVRGGVGAGGMYLLNYGMTGSGPRSTASLIGGGAAMGASYGGPLGAGIGAGAGATIAGWKNYPANSAMGALLMGAPGAALGLAVTGGKRWGGILGELATTGNPLALFRSFWKSASEKLSEKVRQIYQISVDKGFSEQILAMAKDQFGGNLDMAIRAPQIRDLIELYAMATGQKMTGRAMQLPTVLSQSGGILSQVPSYYNGAVYTGTTTGMVAGQSQPIQININGDSAARALRGEVVPAIISNPRAVSAANLEAGRQSFNRRELAAQVLQPSLLLA